MSQVPPAAALEQARQQAQARYADLSAELAALAETTAEVPDDEHDAEGSTIGYERARVTALRRQAGQDLAAVQEAMTRLAAGRYGRCQRCGAEIPAERLVALPSTGLCVACASSGTG